MVMIVVVYILIKEMLMSKRRGAGKKRIKKYNPEHNANRMIQLGIENLLDRTRIYGSTNIYKSEVHGHTEGHALIPKKYRRAIDKEVLRLLKEEPTEWKVWLYLAGATEKKISIIELSDCTSQSLDKDLPFIIRKEMSEWPHKEKLLSYNWIAYISNSTDDIMSSPLWEEYFNNLGARDAEVCETSRLKNAIKRGGEDVFIGD